DRYMYIPMIGLLFALVWLVADLAKLKNWNGSVLTLLFLVVVAPLTYLAEAQIGYWRDSYTLFAHTLAVTSQNGLAENSFGSVLFERGDAAGAEEHFKLAVQYSPDLAAAHYNLGMMKQRENDAVEAEKQYKIGLRLSNDPIEKAQMHNN